MAAAYMLCQRKVNAVPCVLRHGTQIGRTKCCTDLHREGRRCRSERGRRHGRRGNVRCELRKQCIEQLLPQIGWELRFQACKCLGSAVPHTRIGAGERAEEHADVAIDALVDRRRMLEEGKCDAADEFDAVVLDKHAS